jgi:hypothetical protein
MEQVRTTALIRELLLRTIMLKWIKRDAEQVKQLPTGAMWIKGVFEPLYMKIENEMIDIRRTLHSNAIFIVKQEWRDNDVLVQFKEKGNIKEFPYMLAMLEAEVQWWIEHLFEESVR